MPELSNASTGAAIINAAIAAMTASEQPQYFREVFPTEGFPRLERPATMPAEVWTTETTHRDGQQGGLPLTLEAGLAIYDDICAFSGNSGAIRQAEFFVYRPSDRAMLEGALERYNTPGGLHRVEPTTWIRASSSDVALVRALGVRETGMLASASDYHTFHKFSPGGREQAARVYLEAVERVLEAGLRPRLHLEDCTRAPREFVLPLVEAVMRLAEPYPADQRPKFRVCDTMGLGWPWPTSASDGWPRSIPAIFAALRALGLAPADLEFHPHNDTHLVVANCLAALLAGCGSINGTLLGKGERTGNAPLEGVILHLLGLGYFAAQPPDFRALNTLAERYQAMGQGVPAKYPLFGRDAHRTRAGIHADGLNKFWWMYAFCDTNALLGRPLEVSITKESGLAGLVFMAKQHSGQAWSKDHPNIRAAHQVLQAEFEAGRQSAVEWEELAGLLGYSLSMADQG
jgi:citrate (Re)-synthase